MPRKKPVKTGPGLEATTFLFLASHGLLPPISGIRSACEQLGKSDTSAWSDKQRALLRDMHTNATRLSRAFDSMILLAQVEEGSLAGKDEILNARELMEQASSEATNGLAVTLKCPRTLPVRGDRMMIDAILRNIIVVCSDACRAPKRVEMIGSKNDGIMTLRCVSQMDFSFLEPQAARDESKTRSVVGGTSGLLLSLSSALASGNGGELEMKRTGDDSYTITLMLPAA
jgi:K+-sensing histidine kinase KdpD